MLIMILPNVMREIGIRWVFLIFPIIKSELEASVMAKTSLFFSFTF